MPGADESGSVSWSRRAEGVFLPHKRRRGNACERPAHSHAGTEQRTKCPACPDHPSESPVETLQSRSRAAGLAALQFPRVFT